MAPEPVSVSGSGQGPARWRRTLSDAWLAAAYAGMDVLMRLIVRVYFGRLETVHRERFPGRGPVLVVANHPSTWTDVVVLDVALGRKLHFLAEANLYRPRLRAALLALFGSLPVVVRHDDARRETRNAETIRRCHGLFDRGEVVAIFPEGVSMGDRSLQALKPGAARIALGYHGAGLPLSLVPVGIHYANRTAFRTDVLVQVGRPLHLEAHRADEPSHEAAVQALTWRLQDDLSELILDLPETLRTMEIESLTRMLPHGPGGAAGVFERTRHMVARLDRLRAEDPRRFDVLCRTSWQFHRTCRALGLDAGVLAPGESDWRARLRWSVREVVVLVGAIPAAVGAAIHAAPWLASEVLARRYAPEPTRIAFARIAAGLVLIPLAYVLFAVGLSWAGVRPVSILGVLAVAGLLGLWMLSYQGPARATLGRLRLLLHSWRHPRLVERARRQRHALRMTLEDLLRPDIGAAPGRLGGRS